MSPVQKIVYLVDGSSYLHRAYHAIRNLSNSKGFPTNAVFGFTKMFLKLLAEKQPKYLAVVFDARGPTFRHEIYRDYKANRPPMPENMAMQIPIIKAIVKNLNVKILEKEGYEADDVIGTLARLSEEKGFQVVLVSGDKDFRQLISPKICMWDPMKDRYTDYGSLKNQHGLEPSQFVDVMSLSGDSTDNVPGVPGVGEKTALDLVRKFSNLDNVLDHTQEISKRKLRENLLEFRNRALLSRDLVKINSTVPLDEDVEQLRLGAPNEEGLAELFREMEFRDLWDQFATKRQEPKEYGLCMSEEDLSPLVGHLRETRAMVSIHMVTSGDQPIRSKPQGISICSEVGRAHFIPLATEDSGVPSGLKWGESAGILKGLLEDEEIPKVGHNIKRDAEALKLHGVELKGIHFDTMIASYVINPGLRSHDLGSLAQHYLNLKMREFHTVNNKRKNKKVFSTSHLEEMGEFSCEQADIILRLVNHLDGRLQKDNHEELFYHLEMRLIPVLVEMELAGIKIDIPFFRTLSTRFAQKMKEIEKEIYEEAGMEFNINSPQQLGYVLFEKLQLPVQRRTKRTKKYSTDVKVLNKLAAFPHKMPGLILRYRTLFKLKSTYLDALVDMVSPSTGRIHTTYNQTVTATGRLSSSNPNLQNIPIRGEEGREIRKGFVAEEGHWLVSGDYSQIELRIFAHYSEDVAFVEAFKRDQDIHAQTASELLGVPIGAVTPDMRRIAKAINFGIIYGMGPQRLSDELGIDRKKAKEYIFAYYEKHQGVARYREDMIEGAKQNGYVTTLFNRRRYLPEIRHEKGVIRAEAERMAINTPIQGTAADLIKKAMVTIHERLEREGFRSRMLLQVHDELVFEVPEKELSRVYPLIRDEMEGVYPLKVPLKVDIHMGKNWDEAH